MGLSLDTYTKYKLKTLKVRNASGAPHATIIAQPGLSHCVLETYFSFPLDKSSNTKPGLQPSFDRLMQQHRWAFCRHDRCQSTVSQICWQPEFFLPAVYPCDPMNNWTLWLPATAQHHERLLYGTHISILRKEQNAECVFS